MVCLQTRYPRCVCPPPSLWTISPTQGRLRFTQGTCKFSYCAVLNYLFIIRRDVVVDLCNVELCSAINTTYQTTKIRYCSADFGIEGFIMGFGKHVEFYV